MATGQRTSASAKQGAKTRQSEAKVESSAPTSAAEEGSRSTKSSSKDEYEFVNHPFEPGTEVSFHKAADAEPHLHNDSAIPDSGESSKVSKDGSLSIGGLDKGQYVAAGEVAGETRYIRFTVKDEDAAKRKKSEAMSRKADVIA